MKKINKTFKTTILSLIFLTSTKQLVLAQQTQNSPDGLVTVTSQNMSSQAGSCCPLFFALNLTGANSGLSSRCWVESLSGCKDFCIIENPNPHQWGVPQTGNTVACSNSAGVTPGFVYNANSVGMKYSICFNCPAPVCGSFRIWYYDPSTIPATLKHFDTVEGCCY